MISVQVSADAGNVPCSGSVAEPEKLIVSPTFNVANTAPTALITSPGPATTWKVGDTISFSGSATDPEQGTLPASALTWTLIMHHCPSDCHTHTITSMTAASGTFTA